MDRLKREGDPIPGQPALPVPQVWDPTANNGQGDWVRVHGVHNAIKVTLTGSNLALRQTIVTGAKTVTSTAAEIFAGGSRLSGRHAMVVTNTGSDIVYLGASGVTTNNGFPLFPQDTVRFEFNPQTSVGLFGVTSGPNVQVRVVELA